MSDWDLSNLKQKHVYAEGIPVVCDPGNLSHIITLSHSELADNEALNVSVAGYIEEAPWLNAKLQNGSVSESHLQYKLTNRDKVNVVLECTREPTDDEIAMASQKQFMFSVTLQVKHDDGRSHNLRVEIVNPRLQTLIWQPPSIDVKQLAIPEISRVEKEDQNDVDLFNISAKQPTQKLEFGGDVTQAHISGQLISVIDGEETEIASHLELGSNLSRSHIGIPFKLHAGDDALIPCTVSINEVFDAAVGADNLSMQYKWTCSFGDNGRKPISGTYKFELGLRQGEILSLIHGNTSAVPNMTHNATTFAERFPLEFSVPISDSSIQFDLGDTIEFEVTTLDDSWNIVAHAHIQPMDELNALETADDFKLLQNFNLDKSEGNKIQIPFDNANFDEDDETDRYQLFIRFEAQRVKLHTGPSLLEDDDLLERKFGTVAIDIVLRQRDPKYLICLDYGASAIAAWFGRVERNLVRQLIPLGSFAYSLAGAHSEYDPNKRRWQNVLLPSTVGLNPNKHLRSRKAPLSYGNLSMAGSKLPAAEKRMAVHDRTYDVSLPVDRDFLSTDVDAAFMDVQPVAITDLKRMLMSADAGFKHRLKQSVLERNAHGLQATKEIDLEALTKDVFHELGSYLIPNALYYAHDQVDGPIADETGDERADQWLEYADTELQVVITHPSGISQNKQQLYKNAGRSFTTGLTASPPSSAMREPKLIPEALAAAYFGISRSPARDEGTKIFACLDIGASTVDASLIEAKMRHDSIESWTVFAHFGATIGGANLDEALVSLMIRSLRDLFSSSDPVFEDIELDHQYLRDEALKNALLPRVQQAKRALSEELMRRAGPDGEYKWADEGPGSSFSVELNDIMRSAVSGKPLGERKTAIPGSDGKINLHVKTNKTAGQTISLEISSDLLDADDPLVNPARSNPQTVARTLGHAVPAMLIREARRLNVGDPQWVITGRSSLWPSIFSGIRQTAKIFDQDADAVPRKPFIADDMKNATVYGAARLATAGLEITDGVDHSYALVLHDDGRGVVSEIEYLDTRSRSEGSKSVRFLPNRWLSRVLPGLNEVGTSQDIEREEIVNLFGIFGQKVVVDQCQVKPGGLAGGHDQLVEISWKRRNSDVEFTVGDIIVRQPRNRLAGT